VDFPQPAGPTSTTSVFRGRRITSGLAELVSAAIEMSYSPLLD